LSRETLGMLPDELRNVYFEQEVAQLSRDLSTEKKKAAITRDMSILLDLEDVGRSVALRSTASSKASLASSPRVFRGEPQGTRR
jgi:hypothetical protein